MGPFLLSLMAGIAGALTARSLMRREIDELRRELRGEQAPVPAPAAAPKPAAAAAPAPQVSAEITPEILMVLSAAVAAFLGKKAKIKRARLAPITQGSAWAQQGRVFVQASHNLPTPHHH